MEGAARARLIEEHLPLVRSVAAAYAHRGESFDDLLQVGTIGLIGAVDAFERRRGCPFGAYAATRIRGEIRRHLRDRAAPARVPRPRARGGRPPPSPRGSAAPPGCRIWRPPAVCRPRRPAARSAPGGSWGR